MHASGRLGGGTISGAGLIVVTGCAHPGVVEMVRRAKESFGGPVAWVIGGFHLGGADELHIAGIIEDMRRLGVQRVAPCHCSGDRARCLFHKAFGPAYSPAGAGWSISD